MKACRVDTGLGGFQKLLRGPETRLPALGLVVGERSMKGAHKSASVGSHQGLCRAPGRALGGVTPDSGPPLLTLHSPGDSPIYKTPPRERLCLFPLWGAARLTSEE